MATQTDPKEKGNGKTKPIGNKAMIDVATQDELKKLGWRVDKVESGFIASEINGDRRIGPAASLAALKTQVNIASGSPTAAAAPTNGNGKAKEDVYPEQRLPTMEEPEIDDLNFQADKCIAAKEAKEKAEATFKDECDVMRKKMREYGRKRYKRHGFPFVIEESEKLVIKKPENEKGPKNPSTRKPKVVKGGQL